MKQLLDQAERAFTSGRGKRTTSNPDRVRLAALQVAVERKEAVIGELLLQLARRLIASPSQLA